MTWSYSGNPSASTRDAVRFAIGDTLTADQQLTDEEIDYVLTFKSTVIGAAISCCDGLIARYSRLVTQGVGSISVSYSDRIRQYKELLARLRLRGPAAIPFAGGTTVSGKDLANEDTDRDRPAFDLDSFDRKY